MAYSLTATIGSVRKSELVLTIENFIHSDKVVVVVELVDGREVFVLLFSGSPE